MHDAIERATTACRIRDGYTATPEETTAALRAIGRALDALATADRVLAGRAGRREAVDTIGAPMWAIRLERGGHDVEWFGGEDDAGAFRWTSIPTRAYLFTSAEDAGRVLSDCSRMVQAHARIVCFAGCNDHVHAPKREDDEAAKLRAEVERLRGELAKRDAALEAVRKDAEAGACPAFGGGDDYDRGIVSQARDTLNVIDRHTAGFGKVTA